MIFFDIQIALLLIVIIGSSFIFPANPYSASIFGIIIGILFLLSHRLQNKVYILRGLYWVSKYIFKPKTKINHIIWGCFFIIIGSIPCYRLPTESEVIFFNELTQSNEYWLFGLFIIFFNIMIGLYTYWKHKEKIK